MQVNASSRLKRAVFAACFKVKEFGLKFGKVQLPIVDHLAFSAVKARLGGRVRLVVSGGAPLANHVEHFLKVTMCAPVTQVCTTPSTFSVIAGVQHVLCSS
jgi:long-chain acyl-CoA synthetase